MCLAAGVCVLVWTGAAWAQRPVWDAAISAGSGASFGRGNGRTVILQTPAYVDLDVIFANDEVPKVEWVVGLQAELQGRVSAGVVPQVRMTTGPGRYMGYGLLGVPVVVAPFVLAGVEGGGGFLYRFHDIAGVFVEVVVDMLFLGSDIKGNGAVVQTDANVGIRVRF